MGTHRISAEDVVDYLAKLPTGQKRPSLRELQVALGGGSLDTLGRGMREFLKRQEETANVPEDFAAAGSELTTRLWQTALVHIQKAREEERAATAEQIETLEKGIAALEAKNAELAKQVEGRGRQMDRLLGELHAAKTEAATAKDRSERLQEEFAALKQQLKEERAEARKVARELTQEKVKCAQAQSALEAFKTALKAPKS